MELNLFNDQASSIWKRISGEPAPDLMKLELDLYRKLLIYFQIGESCYYIFNFHTLQFDFVSKETESVLGYRPEEFTTDVVMGSVHPDDRAWFLGTQDTTGRFLMGLPPEKQFKYKLRFDCRIRRKDGRYIRVMQQVVVLQADSDGGIMRTLVVHTDISHLKQQGRPILSFIGMDGEPSYQDVDVNSVAPVSNGVLSTREREILVLMADGKLSKEISELLGISKQTVDTHRKNMLRKTELKNTGELISKAIREGWI